MPQHQRPQQQTGKVSHQKLRELKARFALLQSGCLQTVNGLALPTFCLRCCVTLLFVSCHPRLRACSSTVFMSMLSIYPSMHIEAKDMESASGSCPVFCVSFSVPASTANKYKGYYSNWLYLCNASRTTSHHHKAININAWNKKDYHTNHKHHV